MTGAIVDKVKQGGGNERHEATFSPVEGRRFFETASAFESEDKKLMIRKVLGGRVMKGQEIVTMDIGAMSSIADYMVVVTGTSNRHVKSMADELMKRSKEADHMPIGMEGQEQGEWVLIDLGDVIVHIMQGATRKLYDLESLWKLVPGGKKDQL